MPNLASSPAALAKSQKAEGMGTGATPAHPALPIGLRLMLRHEGGGEFSSKAVPDNAICIDPESKVDMANLLGNETSPKMTYFIANLCLNRLYTPQ